MSVRYVVVLAALGLAAGATRLEAEPTFLSRQYTRCTTCHYSPTGGGLLTPYGRSLSARELSTGSAGGEPTAQPPRGRSEHDFLWGLLGLHLAPFDLGLDLRPARLAFDTEGAHDSRGLLMTADLLAAYRAHGFTVYGELGREPLPEGSKIDSYEHWVSYQTERGLGLRVGRFLPAYGIRLADHTALTRGPLGFDVYDQVYGLELSRSSQRSLVQVTLSPGRAESLVHDDGRRAFTATGRLQWDFGPRSVLVVSGLFRDASTLVPRGGAGGLAYGLAPTSHVSVWSEVDAQWQQGSTGYTFLNETAFEVHRGLWLKISPQLRTEPGVASAGLERLALEANWLPRTHINVDLSYYRDRNRSTDVVTRTWLAQLHLYL